MKEENTRSTVIQQKDALWQLFARTSHFIAKARERELMRLSISQFTSSVLFTVIRQGKRATPASIAQELLLEPHTISEHLKRMEHEGLIRKTKDPKKRSRTLVTVTDRGCEVFRKSAARQFTRKVMSVLTPQERRILWRLLARLRDKALLEAEMHLPVVYPPSSPTKLSGTTVNLKAAMPCNLGEQATDKILRRR